MLKKILIIIVTLLLCIQFSLAFSIPQLSVSGYSEPFYFASPTLKQYTLASDINDNIEDVIITSSYSTISNSQSILLTDNNIDSDLTDIEIVTFDEDDNTIIVLTLDTSILTLKGIYNVGTTLSSFPVIFDYNSDGIKEIVFATTGGEVKAIQFNETSRIFYETTSKTFNEDIVSIRCLNLTGFQTLRGTINDSGVHCTFVDDNNFIHEYDDSFSFNWLNISICNGETRTLIQPRGLVYPHLITDLDGSPNFDIAYTCTPSTETVDNRGIAVYIYDSNNNTLASEVMNAGTSNGCNNLPASKTQTMGMSNLFTGGISDNILFTGITCDSTGEKQKYFSIVKDVNDNTIRNIAYTGATGSCDAVNICYFDKWLPPFIADIDSIFPADEWCIGGSYRDKLGTRLNTNVFNCYTSFSGSPILTQLNKTQMTNFNDYGSYYLSADFDDNFFNNTIFYTSNAQVYKFDFKGNTTIVVKNLSQGKAGVYYISGINFDNVYDFIGIDSITGLTVEASFVEQSKPTFTTINRNTGLTVCDDSIVTFSIGFTDLNTDNTIKGRIDCYGNGNFSDYTDFNTLSNSPLLLQCVYNNTGSYTPIVEIEDNTGLNNSKTLTSGNIIDDVPPNCFNSGTGGFSDVVGETDVTGSVALDFEKNVSDLVVNWSTITKFAFSLLVVFIFLMAIGFSDLQTSGKGIFMAVGTAVLLIGFAFVGFIPSWVVLMLFLIASLTALVLFRGGRSE